MGDGLAINWRYFSLEQVNNIVGGEWKIWEQPEDYPSMGLPAFKAAEASRRQGEDAFMRLHMMLYEARHKNHKNISDIDGIVKIAESSGIDITRFKKDLYAKDILKKLEEDHTYAVETLKIFGTPTLVFPDNETIFLRLVPVPPPDTPTRMLPNISIK